MFAAIREAYGIPRDPDLKLRDFPTLRHVIRFVYDRSPGLRPPDGGGTPAGGGGAPGGGAAADREGNGGTTPSAAPSASPAALRDVADADRVPRRVPVPALRPMLARSKPTGVALASGRRVVVALDRGGIGKALVERLEKLGVAVLVLAADAEAAALADQVAAWRAGGSIHGVYWLAALDVEPALSDLDLAGWRAGLGGRVKRLAALMRLLYEDIAPSGTFLVAAVRLDGRHGYGSGAVAAPMGGAVTGFAKAYARERPEALVKAVDVGAGGKAAELAQALVDEALRDPGAVEIGRHARERWTVALVERPAADGRGGLALGRESVFVVTGAAGSIVAAITADLAAAAGGVFHLLDRVPAPAPDDPDVVRFARDREGLKRDVFERLKARGERATPALVERELAGIERRHAAASAIAAIEASGGSAHYHCVDLLDGAAVAAVVEDVRSRHGRIDVLLHAAGLEVSRTLPDKPPEEFDRVFDVKSDGWFNLLRAIGDLPLAATVAFGSIAGRFGNRGQTDYSAANDLLCKSTASFRVTRPTTRGLVIDWTAWRDIGMAARGSIPQMMALAGIDMLPPDAGIPTIRRELVAGGCDGEVVVAGSLGVLAAERDPSGGLDPAAVDVAAAGPMVGRVVAHGVADGLRVETELDPRRQPFLDDHRIDGIAVLPGVMGIEAFAEVAALAAPGWQVDAVEDVEFLAPFKFYRDEPRTLTIAAQLVAAEDAELVAECRLSGSRTLAGQSAPTVTVHFTGRVRLRRSRPPLGAARVPGADGSAAIGPETVYRVYFHGPAYRVLGAVARAGDGVIGRFAGGRPANHAPPSAPTRMAPRLVELCFQTAGMREIAASGRLALPRRVGRLRVASAAPEDGATAFVTTAPLAGDGAVDVVVVGADGAPLVRLEGYATVALPAEVAPEDRHAVGAVLAP
ncbi:MAG: SDR family NAD(P)-dependent oxidoreductase [Deltaproteobacteria bacterium]|nr:SDR family NAD(P)-dependent oxidoreductase [Deltaproteobacteria bacterium]